MAVDLSDLVEPLKREVSPPGEDLFPAATETEYVGNLVDGFWEVVLDGLIKNYEVDEDGIVTPRTGTTDLSREMQQLVVFYAGVRIVRNHLRALNTTTRAVAGPVEFETQKSSTMMRDLLKELKDRRNLLLLRLSDIGAVDDYYINAVIAREDSIRYGEDRFN